jgi:hypothetical protein
MTSSKCGIRGYKKKPTERITAELGPRFSGYSGDCFLGILSGVQGGSTSMI